MSYFGIFRKKVIDRKITLLYIMIKLILLLYNRREQDDEQL